MAVVFSLLFAAVVLAGAAPSPSRALTADFAGDGRAETATARLSGKTVALEIANADGKRVASADAPAPGGSGKSAVFLTSGALGSAGSLIDVVAASADEKCHSVWRFHDGALSRLPIQHGAETLPDCARPGGWAERWENKAKGSPAVWVRERARETPRGAHREYEVYAFTGFALELDALRSTAEIAGIAIPAWRDYVLYSKSALDLLSSRFDLSDFRSAPRLRVRADRSAGVFDVELKDHAGKLDAAVTAVKPGGGTNEVTLTVQTENGPRDLHVTARGGVVMEVRVTGLSPRWDALYVPASRFTGSAIEVYARAEDETAANHLVGLWTSERGEQLALNVVPGVPGVLDMRRSQVEVSLDSVPAGADVLLIPRDGSAPAWALVLKGNNGFDRVPVKCGGPSAGAWSCEASAQAEPFHRVGGRMNAR